MQENSKEYSVGQIVYIILDAKKQVLPVQIAEVIKKYTLSGEQIQYKVMMPQKNSSGRTYDLNELSNKVFETIEGVQEYLTEIFQQQISQIMEKATMQSYFFETKDKDDSKDSPNAEESSGDVVEKEISEVDKDLSGELEDEERLIRDSNGAVIGKIGKISG